MSDFLFPVGLLLFCVFLGFFVAVYFVRLWYFAPLHRRLKRLEYLVQQPHRTTEDVVPIRVNTPRPSPQKRYVSVEREPRPEFYQEV